VGGGLALVRRARLATVPAAAAPAEGAAVAPASAPLPPPNAPLPPPAGTQAAAPSATAAAAPDPTVQAPLLVTVILEAEPRRARWSLDGGPLAGNPAQATCDARSTHTATASAPGFAEASLLVRFDAAHVEKLALSPLRRGAPHHEASPATPPPATHEKPRARATDEGMTIERDNPFKHAP
jgi:hypothetical protein